MSRADRFEFTLDEDTEKRLHELLTDMDTRNTNRFWITDKRGYRAEYVKVKHSKWIRDEFGARCGVCGLYAYRDKFDQPWESPYCPNCGADMRGEENDRK